MRDAMHVRECRGRESREPSLGVVVKDSRAPRPEGHLVFST
jgi:hypothetical protein